MHSFRVCYMMRRILKRRTLTGKNGATASSTATEKTGLLLCIDLQNARELKLRALLRIGPRVLLGIDFWHLKHLIAIETVGKLYSRDKHRLIPYAVNLKTGLPNDAIEPKKEVVHAPFPASKPSASMLSIAEMIDEHYGFNDRNQTMASVSPRKVVVLRESHYLLPNRDSYFVKHLANFMGSSRKIDSEDEIDTPERPRKRRRNISTGPMLSETPNRPRAPSPAIAPIEIHKAAFQAAFRDKSVKRTELFHALLPYITVADAEEILLRCQQVAAVISESKFE